MRHLRLLAVLVSLVAVNVWTASAQTTSGSLSGTVVDNDDRVIPGATVTIVNEKTGEERRSVSDAVGAFLFPALPPGPYSVKAELPGFKPLELRNNIVLANNRLAIAPLKLQVGTITETVTVNSRGEVVATTVTAHQAILDLTQVTNLSIRGRDPISLLKVLPGVSLLANDQETVGGSFATAVPNIQGGRGQTIYVDGINGGDGGTGGGGGSNFSGTTNLDAIAEVNVQMSAYTAEYGLKGGAQVNYITKRGGSDYHGTGYWYRRHEMFNATNFFNNRDAIAKPVYRYSTLGGNLGGPVPKIPRINSDGKRLYFFYSLDDTQLKDANILRRYMMPTQAERAGDFSNTRTTSGALIVVRDPITQQPFPNNIVPADRANAAGVALLNLLPMPNASGSGYNFLTQEDSIPHPRRQHLTRIDYRPTMNDTFSGKYQSWYTKSVGWNVAGASSRFGLVRQRYDFTSDQGKLDYTRILNSRTVLEVSTGIFRSTENGPPEDDKALAGIQRSTYPALANLPQFAKLNNPLNLIPRVQFGTVQSNSQEVPNITYDGRWPITGEDIAFAIAANLTHSRGPHTFKLGLLREHEQFGQAKSGTFGGEFSFANDGNDPNNAGFAYANAFLGHVTSYTESMGRVPDDRWQTTWAWFVQDTWKVHPKVTMDIGMRMYKWAPAVSNTGQASGFSFERFDPKWGGKPPVLFQPTTTAQGRRAVNPLTGEILPVTYVGLMVPGTGYSCGVITVENPCQINGIVIQNDPTYTDIGVGFSNNLPIQYDPRLGIAYALNSKTVFRVAGGFFHDGTGGAYLQQGGGNLAYRFDRVVRFTDMASYLTATSATAPATVAGAERLNQKRPLTYRYTAAVQRDIGAHLVLDVAYVGDQTRFLAQDWNYNAVPAGARFLPQNRDLTVPDSATVGLQPNKPNPGALPDAFLRPIIGFGDINISSPRGSSSYNSVQTQLTRRFTGGFEASASYTWARGFATGINQNNPLPSYTANTRSDIQEHVLVASYSIDVPDGSKLIPGKAAAWVLDNWRISGITTFATGGISNVTVSSFGDSFDFSGGGETCGNIVQTGDANLPSGERTVDRWFDTSVFQRPSGRGGIGNNCYNDKVHLPGFNNHDLSIFKDFRMRGNQKMQFRWEIYNLLNSTQFNAVNTAAQFDAAGRQTNVNFGKVTSARNERRMQLSLRFVF
jgi:carboxypeptidase family protein